MRYRCNRSQEPTAATSRRYFVLLALSTLILLSPAAKVKDREAAVRKDRAMLANDSRWIYNDFQRGFQEAKRVRKPLLVVLRCVPCLVCAGIDSAVLLEESELAPLLNQFVCVRIIDANALDLKLFQFDYDLFSKISRTTLAAAAELERTRWRRW